MPKLLFIRRDSQSTSLKGSGDNRERALINSHVQAHRKHLRKANPQIEPTSSRPRFLEFQRKRDIEITHDSDKENDRSTEASSSETSNDLDTEKQREEDFRLFDDTFYNDDWTVNMVSASSQRRVDVRQDSQYSSFDVLD